MIRRGRRKGSTTTYWSDSEKRVLVRLYVTTTKYRDMVTILTKRTAKSLYSKVNLLLLTGEMYLIAEKIEHIPLSRLLDDLGAEK
jgi:hypothetical protein